MGKNGKNATDVEMQMDLLVLYSISLSMSIYLSTYLLVCLSVYLSVYYIYINIHIYIYTYIYICIHTCITYIYHIHPGKVKADRAAALAAVRQSPEAPIGEISDPGFSTDVIDVIRNNHLVEIIL